MTKFGKKKCHTELAIGKTSDITRNPTLLTVCLSALLFAMVNAILIGNLSFCKILNSCKIKNMSVLSIFRFSVCGGQPDNETQSPDVSS
jgi:hypothetical protein